MKRSTTIKYPNLRTIGFFRANCALVLFLLIFLHPGTYIHAEGCHGKPWYEDMNFRVISPEGLNIRSKPGLKGEKLKLIPWQGDVTVYQRTNEAVSIDGLNDYWYEVQYAKVRGWIFGGYIEPVSFYNAKQKTVIDSYSGEKNARGVPNGEGVMDYFTFCANEEYCFDRDDQGVVSIRYSGHWKNGKPDGIGSLVVLFEGDFKWSYEGEWKDGNWVKGRLSYPYEYYDGEWKYNRKSGSGVKDCNGNYTYRGEWENDKYDGFGIYSGNDTFYKGGWKCGQPDGSGFLHWGACENLCYQGEFKEGYADGDGEYSFNEESWWGEWSYGHPLDAPDWVDADLTFFFEYW